MISIWILHWTQQFSSAQSYKQKILMINSFLSIFTCHLWASDRVCIVIFAGVIEPKSNIIPCELFTNITLLGFKSLETIMLSKNNSFELIYLCANCFSCISWTPWQTLRNNSISTFVVSFICLFRASCNEPFYSKLIQKPKKRKF